MCLLRWRATGALAAWFRLKYPHVTYASVASSAPVEATLDFFEYLDVVDQSLGESPSPPSNRRRRLQTLLTEPPTRPLPSQSTSWVTSASPTSSRPPPPSASSWPGTTHTTHTRHTYKTAPPACGMFLNIHLTRVSSPGGRGKLQSLFNFCGPIQNELDIANFYSSLAGNWMGTGTAPPRTCTRTAAHARSLVRRVVQCNTTTRTATLSTSSTYARSSWSSASYVAHADASAPALSLFLCFVLWCCVVL
jgi:hypothetical protein